MAEVVPIVERIVKIEGGYVLTNHAGDRGGMTYAGISRDANPNWIGWDRIDSGLTSKDSMATLVQGLYFEKYLLPIKVADIPSQEVAASMASCSVLSGPDTAIRMTQRMFPGLKVDGIMGPITTGAVASIVPGSPEEDLFEARFALARIARYSEIVRRNPDQVKWLRGWVNRSLEDAR